jgi:rhamnose utilization protein RhaD (predicted bifunctional aldolase and dehydrogenase)
MSNRSQQLRALLEFSHELAAPPHPLALLGEGNTSARLSDTRFLVKASGSNLASLRSRDVVECRSKGLLALLDQGKVPDSDVEASLLGSRVDARAKKPSVEALFHAWLLSLPGVGYVGHTHAPSVTGILCSPRAGEFARKRLFPDEIVCCDVESVFVPYTDPGLGLARAIRVHTHRFISKYSRPPRVILLKNHGIITLGHSPQAVMAAMLMAEKAASIWTGAAALGGPVFLTAQQVSRISTRPDEALRRKKLKI